MAEPLKLRIFDLVAEISAYALRVLALLEHAGTVAAGSLKTVLDGLDDLCIRIECYFHKINAPFISVRTKAEQGGPIMRTARHEA